MTTHQVSVGPLSGQLKPKYKVITALGMDPKYQMPNKKDVYIDLNTMINSGASYKKYLMSLPFSQDAEKDIVYTILMIVKHWKDYLRSYEDSRIFLIMNDFDMIMLAEGDTLRSYLLPYVNKFESDILQQFVYYWKEAIKCVEIILKYIPGVYFIRCNRFDSYVVPNLIDDYTKNDRHRVIISNNNLMTNYTYMPNTTMFFSRYTRNGVSQITDPAMIVSYLTKIDEPIMDVFCQNRVFYNMLNEIVGDFDRGIVGISNLGISSFALELLRAVEKNMIPQHPESIESVLPVVNKNYQSYLQKNYPLIDIDTHTKMIPKSMVESMKSMMVDLYDIDGLNKFNINGFSPLELL